jgi:hypothetical protein
MLHSIDKITFRTGVVREYSALSSVDDLGTHEQTMELYRGDNGNIFIEWDIPELEETAEIGIEYDGKKVVTGYDGLMSLPLEAIQLLERNGFNCDEMREVHDFPVRPKEYHELNAICEVKSLPQSDKYDGDTQCAIITVSVDLQAESYTYVKNAILAQQLKREEIFIPRSYSEYDCTGKWSTSSLTLVHRFVNHGMLHYIWKHHLSCDV